jgi:hypothetical protein
LLLIQISSLLTIARIRLAWLGISLCRRTARLASVSRLQITRVGEVGRSDAAIAAAVVEVASRASLAGAAGANAAQFVIIAAFRAFTLVFLVTWHSCLLVCAENFMVVRLLIATIGKQARET